MRFCRLSRRDWLRLEAQFIWGACCNLHPTGFEEPFGLSVIEAGFCGTPTLAIRRGSMSEVIEDGETGILVEDFVAGRRRLAECMRLNRRRISERSRERFDLRRMASGDLTVYSQIRGRQVSSRLNHSLERRCS